MSMLVTLVNRTSKTLSGMWDGKPYSFAPNAKYQFPEIQAQKFKEQNPIMGSEDPISGNIYYLMGIPEWNDDCSPIEPATASTRRPLESYQKEVEAPRGLYSPSNIDRPNLGENSFVKP